MNTRQLKTKTKQINRMMTAQKLLNALLRSPDFNICKSQNLRDGVAFFDDSPEGLTKIEICILLKGDSEALIVHTFSREYSLKVKEALRQGGYRKSIKVTSKS